MSAQEWGKAEIDYWTKEKRNWMRWGADDEIGAVNMIDETKRLRALQTIQLGKSISLARPLSPDSEDDGIAGTAKHRVDIYPNAALDFVDFPMHMTTGTHIDALDHLWDAHGMYNGHDPAEVFVDGKSQWGDISVWRDGIITRGILIDVPKHRGKGSITMEEPPTYDELKQIADAQGVVIEPGDALVIYSGRAAWEEAHDGSYCIWLDTGTEERPDDYFEYRRQPGLEVSCLRFIRETDCSVVIWDMWDEHPHGQSEHLVYSVHSAIWAYGVAIIDGASLERLAQTCHELNRYEFAVVISPLHIKGGTGSPVNPLAIF
jgi:kynurenine formamidase